MAVDMIVDMAVGVVVIVFEEVGDIEVDDVVDMEYKPDVLGDT